MSHDGSGPSDDSEEERKAKQQRGLNRSGRKKGVKNKIKAFNLAEFMQQREPLDQSGHNRTRDDVLFEVLYRRSTGLDGKAPSVAAAKFVAEYRLQKPQYHDFPAPKPMSEMTVDELISHIGDASTAAHNGEIPQQTYDFVKDSTLTQIGLKMNLESKEQFEELKRRIEAGTFFTDPATKSKKDVDI